MQTPALTQLHRRDFSLGDAQLNVKPGAWYEDDPFLTQVLNVYTLLIPEGERFIIRTCRHHEKGASPALQAALAQLFFQEGSHAREHRKVVEAMSDAGLGMGAFRRAISVVSYRLLEPLFPAWVRLSTAAAIEHHNAVIAEWFLRKDLLRTVKNGALRRLFVWHFAEEIEHKETVFQLLQSVSRSWWLRGLGLILSTLTFLLFTVVGALLIGVRTGEIAGTRFWKSAAYQCLRRNGLLRTLGRESIRYLRPRFRPNPQTTEDILNAALAELASLEATASNLSGAPVAKPLPQAFRTGLDAFQARKSAFELNHRFFFSRIDGYDGPKVKSGGVAMLNFCTYSYLGLLHHPDIQAAARSALDRYGTGTHGVRLLGGNLKVHEDLESKLAAFFGREAALVFSSGFMTNLTVISALMKPGDYIVSDECNHASIIDGCRQSGAELHRVRHNDVDDFDRTLSQIPAEARKMIVVDAVYSMDGDIAPLPELTALRARHENTIIMVDEAHSLGVLGTRGRGIEEHFGCAGEIDVLMGTLSKAIPAQGGYITGSSSLIDYLRYHTRGFMFSAALSPAASAGALAALAVIDAEGAVRRQRLMDVARYFVTQLQNEGFDTGNSRSAIVPVMLGDENLAFEMAGECHKRGVFAMPVAYPAVARGSERLRMNVTADHSRTDIDRAVGVLVQSRESAVRRTDTCARSSSYDQETLAARTRA